MTGLTKYPDYIVHWKTGVGQLQDLMAYATPIRGEKAETSHITLSPTGGLYLKTGYVWDFGSGPAIDTPDMVYASLAHDALYELMVLEKLSWDYRKAADDYFIELCKSAGMPAWRRFYVYVAVRVGYPIMKALGKMGK